MHIWPRANLARPPQHIDPGMTTSSDNGYDNKVWQQGYDNGYDNMGQICLAHSPGQICAQDSPTELAKPTQTPNRRPGYDNGMTKGMTMVWQQNTINIGIQNGTLTQNDQHARHPCLLPTCGWGGPLQQLEELCATWGALCRRMRMYRSCICIRMYMYMDKDFCNGLASRQYIYHCFYNELHCFCVQAMHISLIF